MKLNMPVTGREHEYGEQRVIVSKTDLKGIITEVNADFIDISGYSREELLGKNHNIVRHPDMPPAAFQDLWDTLKTGRPWSGVVKNRCKNGDHYWVVAQVSPIKEHGQITGYLSVRKKPGKEAVEKADALYRRMNAGGKPATGLLGRMNVLKKTTIQTLLYSVSAMLLVAMLTPLYFLVAELNENIAVAEQERIGVEYIAPVRKLLEDIPKHRGMANAYLGGDAGFRERLATLESKIEEDIRGIDAVNGKYGAALKVGENWNAIKNKWAGLRGSYQSMQVKDSLAAHTALINDIIEFIATVADASSMILDPKTDSYYLIDTLVNKLPQLTENMGLSRAGGIAYIVQTKAGKQDEAEHSKVQLTYLASAIKIAIGTTVSNLEKVYDVNGPLRARLEPPFLGAAGAARSLIDLLENKLLKGNGSVETTADEMYGASTNALDQVFKFYDALGPVVDELVTQRAASLTQKRTLILCLSLLLALLAGCCLIYTIRRITGPLKRTIGHFENIADGNYSGAIEVPYQDEIGQLLESLKAMQTKLGYDMVAAKQTADESLRIKNALDHVSTNIMIADGSRNIIYVNKALLAMFKGAESDIRKELPHFDAERLIGTNIDSFHKVPERQQQLLANLSHAHQAPILIGGRTFQVVANPVINEQGERLGSVAEWQDRTAEVRAEQQIEHLVEAAIAGQLDTRVDTAQLSEGFLRRTGQGINQVLDSVLGPINEGAGVLARMAEGDLSTPMGGDYQGGHAEIKDAINACLDGLNVVLHQSSHVVDQVNQATSQLGVTANSLASNSEQQSAAVEEITASLEQTDSQIKANTDSANAANQLVIETAQAAKIGQERMQAMLESMQAIDQSSQSIAKIIKVIDEIAFQTNLLALNAAVEAARAGQHGRGFAVVAQEVRNLARRSAKAARETAELIDGSVRKVSEGVAVSGETREALEKIVGNVVKMKDFMAEIATASSEQSRGIGQISTGMGEVAHGTQETSQQSEELAAAADELGRLAQSLRQEVGRFRLNNDRRYVVDTLRAVEMPAVADVSSRSGSTGPVAKKPPRALPAAKPSQALSPKAVLPLDHDERGFGPF